MVRKTINCQIIYEYSYNITKLDNIYDNILIKKLMDYIGIMVSISLALVMCPLFS